MKILLLTLLPLLSDLQVTLPRSLVPDLILLEGFVLIPNCDENTTLSTNLPGGGFLY
jgi:hypothetical protein